MNLTDCMNIFCSIRISTCTVYIIKYTVFFVTIICRKLGKYFSARAKNGKYKLIVLDTPKPFYVDTCIMNTINHRNDAAIFSISPNIYFLLYRYAFT